MSVLQRLAGNFASCEASNRFAVLRSNLVAQSAARGSSIGKQVPGHSSAGLDAVLKSQQLWSRPKKDATAALALQEEQVATNGAKPSVAANFGIEDLQTAHLCTLMVQCPDQKGVIAALAQLLYGLGCNIVESDQFTDNTAGLYFQRIRCDFSEIVVGTANTAVLETAVAELALRFQMEWKIFYDAKPKRVAILVSKMDHCLYDLLIRHQRGELKCELPVIISNHPDMEAVAKSFGVAYQYLPIESKSPEAKKAQESQIEAIVEEHNIDLLVLARYMQIFSPEFCQKHAMHTINIHHSFLPAFEGAKPYHRAYERGVKLMGATSHYATSELDAGPIIAQSVTEISHRDSVQDMIRKGRDLERLVLARAVRWVLEDRVLVHGNKTVVFGD